MTRIICCFFLFSSRRRHTRLQGDWSSDVCSSDLPSSILWARSIPSAATHPTVCMSDRKSTRLNSSHLVISYAVFCLKKNNTHHTPRLPLQPRLGLRSLQR